MREPGALRRLLQMKSFLDLEQPSDADAPGEFGRSFEANDGTLDRNDGIRPAWAPIGIDKLLRIVRVALETRSEEHTSELQSLMRNSYAVFCLKKKNHNTLPHT